MIKMENRIASRMKQLREKDGKSLSTVIMIGDPDLDTTFELLEIALDAGVDVFEIGIPISVPFLDSDVMRDSMLRALAFSPEYDFYLEALCKIRDRFPEVIVEVMIYYETVMDIGLDKFCAALEESQMDCVLVADGVFQGSKFLSVLDEKLLPRNIYPIRFVPNPYDNQQFGDLKRNAHGFVIVQTKTDAQGLRQTVLDKNKQSLEEIRLAGIDLPLIFAYGIKTPEDVRKCISLGADGVLIGTVLLDVAHRLPRADYGKLLRQLRKAAAQVS
jgi:tryptophan synthase alpha chain